MVIGRIITSIGHDGGAIAHADVETAIVHSQHEHSRQVVESPYVSDKAKQVARELCDTLVMKQEDTFATSDTLFRVDDGLKPSEDDKVYMKAITDAFNNMPELVRANVHSLTFESKPNGLYGHTDSIVGDITMNMQYYHPELTHGEPGSLQQSMEVLAHEVGHIFNGKSLRDGNTWSFSRDPKYMELAKEVYKDNLGDIHGRWASDFGAYVSWINGLSTPADEGQQKIYSYMNTLFGDILAPSNDRISSELKQMVDQARSSGKHVIYDGHVSLDATYENAKSIQSRVNALNHSEVVKFSTDSNTIHFKTFGINKVVTTRYLVNGVEVSEKVTSKADAGQKDITGYTFVNRETSHDGLLIDYHYRANDAYTETNEFLDAALDIQQGKSYVRAKNEANLRFTIKKDIPNLNIEYRIINLTTGNEQTSLEGERYPEDGTFVESTPLNGHNKPVVKDHQVGSVSAGYSASANLQYRIHNGIDGDNQYRLTAIFKDGNTEIGRVSKDFVGEVISHNKGELSGIRFLSQVENDGKHVVGIVKNNQLYRPSVLTIAKRSDESKQKNEALAKRRQTLFPTEDKSDSVSRQARIRFTVYDPNYRFNLTNTKHFETIKNASDGYVNVDRGDQITKDDKGAYVVTRRLKAFDDTLIGLMYVGDDQTPRTDHVKVKVEVIDTSSGKEQVIEERMVTGDFTIVNYTDALAPNFSTGFKIEAVSNVGKSTSSGDSYSIDTGTYGTELGTRIMWHFGEWQDHTENGASTYDMGNISNNKFVMLENFVGMNLKHNTDALFSDVHYATHFDIPEHADGSALSFHEIILDSSITRDTHYLDGGAYKETVYWIDRDGQRHLLQERTSQNRKSFISKYRIPNEARSFEIETKGKVPSNYQPVYLVRYITNESYTKVKEDHRYLQPNESNVFDHRAYLFKATVTDHVTGEERNLDTKSVIKDGSGLWLRTDTVENGFDPRNVKYNEVLNVTGTQRVNSLHPSLNINPNVDISASIDDSFPMTRVLLLEKDVQLAESGWDKRSTFTFNGHEFTLYTKPYNSSRDINLSDSDVNVMLKPSETDLLTHKQYIMYTGLIFQQTANMPSLRLSVSNTRPMLEEHDGNERLDRKVMAELGIQSQNSESGENVRLTSARLLLSASRSLEFQASQTIKDNGLSQKTHYDAAGKTLSIDVDVINSNQVVSQSLEIIQRLPQGSLGTTFVGVNENPNYDVYYTSDDTVDSTSTWNAVKPTHVTGVKWVRKTALGANKIDTVGYRIQVASDVSSLKKATAGGYVINNHLRSTLSDVTLINHQEESHVSIVVRKVKEDGSVISEWTPVRKRLPKGEVTYIREIIPTWILSDYHRRNLYNVSGIAIDKVPSYNENTYDALWTPTEDNHVIYFDEVIRQSEKNERRTYKTTWDGGYVEPDLNDLINLFSNVRSYTYLPGESSQKVKVFDIRYHDGSHGKGYVDISIDTISEPVTEINNGITYRGDDTKDLGYRNATSGSNHTYTNMKTYDADDKGIFHETVTVTDDIPSSNAIITLGTKPSRKVDIVARANRVVKDPTKPLGYRHVDEGNDGYVETITYHDVDPTTGALNDRTETRTVDPIDHVVTEGSLAWDLPTTGTTDTVLTLSGLAGMLLITKRKKASK